MRKSLCTVGALTVFLLISAMHTASAKTCQDLLDNNTYRCQLKPPPGTFEPFEVCFTFIAEAPGTQLNFVLHLIAGGEVFPLVCACKAGGSFQNPAFGTSKEFLCASSLHEGFTNLAVEGVAGKDKISGQIVEETTGFPYVYQCVLDPTCEGSQGGTQSTDSPRKRLQP
jgi:hypothetical protein